MSTLILASVNKPVARPLSVVHVSHQSCVPLLSLFRIS